MLHSHIHATNALDTEVGEWVCVCVLTNYVVQRDNLDILRNVALYRIIMLWTQY